MTNSEMLNRKLDKAVADGEVPYQENRTAVEELDIQGKYEEGKQHLLVMLEGIDLFITDLEDFAHAAEKVNQWASRSTVR